jgi:hypothetical protein
MSVGYQNGGKNQQAEAQSGGKGADPADWDALKGDVGEIANAAVERGRHFLDSARDQATGYVDRRKEDVAQSVTDLATSLREATSSFEDRPNIRAFVDSAAEGLNQFADSIRERTVTDIFNDVEDVVRQRPAAVAAVTVAIGFIAARFIKSSAEGMRQGYGSEADSMRTGARRTTQAQSPRGASGPQAGV